MDPSLEEAASDSLERSKMSLDQKRQRVYELSKNPDEAFKALKSWTSQELRHILCLESERPRKYTGLAKEDLIKILLTTVSDKNHGDGAVEEKSATPSTSKRQRTALAQTKGKGTTICCKNWACRAILNGKDIFCKRCSCYICLKYDGNKDPSLWLTCDGESCGCSFHLECAINSNICGLNDCIYCVSCGKTNSMIKCWKKQLEIAKETESVNELCERLLLAQKLLRGTEKYKDISEIVEKATESLVTELCGLPSSKCRVPLSSIPSSKRRGSIKRLGLKAMEVKSHCSSALKSLQEKLTAADVLLGMFANRSNLSAAPSSSNISPEVKQEAIPEDLPIAPLRLDQISDHQDRLANRSNLSVAPSSSNISPEEKQEAVPEDLPIAPLRLDQISEDFGLGDFVEIMIQLESLGVIEKSVRKKFLSWYGLSATAHERYVVKTYVYGFKDDPKGLVDQLIHTFSECILRKDSANGGGDGGGNSSGVFFKKPQH